MLKPATSVAVVCPESRVGRNEIVTATESVRALVWFRAASGVRSISRHVQDTTYARSVSGLGLAVAMLGRVIRTKLTALHVLVVT